MDNYDNSFFPPAPIIKKVKIKNEFIDKESTNEDGKIDSGASITVIPRKYVNTLGLIPLGVRRVMGFDGQESTESTYLVKLSFKGLNFDKEVITKNRNNILIGRDILNELLVILDGKNLQFDIQDP